MRLNQRQLNAILAGLRLVQQWSDEGINTRYDSEFIDAILTDQVDEPLDADEIDALCMQIDMGGDTYIAPDLEAATEDLNIVSETLFERIREIEQVLGTIPMTLSLDAIARCAQRVEERMRSWVK